MLVWHFRVVNVELIFYFSKNLVSVLQSGQIFSGGNICLFVCYRVSCWRNSSPIHSDSAEIEWEGNIGKSGITGNA